MEVKIIVGEKEYIIGKEYEFSDMLQEDKNFEVKWRKGVLSGYCPHPNSANSFVCGNQYYVHCREKVEELNYEILEYKEISMRPTGPFKNSEFIIYSVKRLSDGEVFTIGDLIDFGDFGNKGSQPIKKIEIDYFDNTRITAWDGAYGIGLEKWKKKPKKTPLFTTADGVEIFVGDDFFVIETQFDKYRLHKTIGGHFTKERSTRLRFHSKEKAEEYVLLNKPCLSIMEVAPIFGQMHLDNSPDVLTRNLAKLKSLVQAKL